MHHSDWILLPLKSERSLVQFHTAQAQANAPSTNVQILERAAIAPSTTLAFPSKYFGYSSYVTCAVLNLLDVKAVLDNVPTKWRASKAGESKLQPEMHFLVF